MAHPLEELLAYHLDHIELEHCGWGFDPYDEARANHHPMAYALYVRGLVNLSQGGGHEYLEPAERLVDVLVRTASPTPGTAWGLPFAWRGYPARHPFAITTALCGMAFAELQRIHPTDRTLELLHAACRWLVDRLPWAQTRTGRAPGYAPGFPLATANVTSMVAGVLSQGSVLTGDAELGAHAQAAGAAVRSAQGTHGAWAYADDASEVGATVDSTTIDNVHTAYTIDGVVSRLLAGSVGEPIANDVKRVASKGIAFYLRYFYEPTGRAHEKVVVVEQGDPEAKKLFDNQQLARQSLGGTQWLVTFPHESRLWGYGAGLGMLARAHGLGLVSLDRVYRIVDFLLADRLRDPSGRYGYLSSDTRRFPRFEAHLFEGLSAVLQGSQGRGALPHP